MTKMLKINGVQIKTPNDLDIEHYNLTKSGRVASGLMTMELIAKKTKLNVSYTFLSGDDLSLVRSLIDGTAMFFDVTYYDLKGSIQTINCYSGAIKYKKYRSSHIDSLNGWYWKNVDFALIER
jgi:hypothetical protein